jgi:predicted nucleic acid-binding protein
MTTYLLDTNACIALINGSQANVRRRLRRAVTRKNVILLSSVVAFELW